MLPAKWHKKGRTPKLSELQAYDLCRVGRVTSTDEAWTLAREQERQGKRALLAFLLTCPSPTCFVERLLQAQTAEERVARMKCSRIELLEAAGLKACECAVEGQWHTLAKEILVNNGHDGTFQQALCKTLSEGRAKMNNLFLLGPPNSGKSFLVKPLLGVYRCYQQPEGGSYQLEAMLGKELCFLNDFEWDASERWCRWAHFKNFLEGLELPIGRPKNRGGDTELKSSMPVVGTACVPIVLYARQGRAMVVNASETAQMDVRVRYLRFAHQIPDDRLVHNVKACSHCASRLYLEGRPVGPAPRGRSRSRRR